MKNFYLIAVLWLIVGLAGAVAAEPPVPPPGDLHTVWNKEDHILSEIGVTHNQKEKIVHLREVLQKDTEELKALRYETIAEMRLLWMNPDSDSDKIMAKAKNFHNLMWRLIKKDMEYRIALRGILTREQYLRFLDLGGFR